MWSSEVPYRNYTPTRVQWPHEPAYRNRLTGVLALYLAGLVLGGLYVGLVAPVRTVIQLQFGIASVTLVRQLGTSVAPAIFVGFLTAMPGTGGFRAMMLAVAMATVLAILVLPAYPGGGVRGGK